MRVVSLQIADVLRIEPRVYRDARGLFLESWRSDAYEGAGVTGPFVQDNQSTSEQWVLRGLHYQVRRPQAKLLRVLTGEIYDIAVDLRAGSKTYGAWVEQRLTAESHHELWVPPGFAHGFLALVPDCRVLYKVTDYWVPELERTLAWNDPQLAIPWPLPPGIEPRMSDKDRAGTLLTSAEACT